MIKALDVNGDESPFGKFVLLSIGGGNASEYWCSKTSRPPCSAGSFMGRAVVDPTVNRYSLVIVNGAADSLDAPLWTSATSAAYDRIKVARLAPLGLSENQVQIAWVNLADPKPTVSLPSDSADAYRFLTNVGLIVRALKVRYPSLQLVFVSSREYGGYSTTDWNPEPYAYEEGLSVKWAIESQINEMRGQAPNPRAGTLSNAKKMAPVMLWGQLMPAPPWPASKEPGDTVPQTSLPTGTEQRGKAKEQVRRVELNQPDIDHDVLVHTFEKVETAEVGLMLLDFFKSSTYTRCWFLANQYCL